MMNTPMSLDLDITNQCNLCCHYCSHFESAGDVKTDLPKEEWLRFFEELNECAVTKVSLCGGEPFYREDLKALISGIVKNKMRFNILSNGTLITDEMASFLTSTRRCDGVQISVDGSNPSTHDVFRGKGNFSRALSGLKILQKHHISVAVRVTIHRQNVRDLEGIAYLLLEEIGLSGFSTNSAHYMGLCQVNSADVQLTVEEQFLAMITLLELNKKYNGRISAAAGPLANARHWLQMEQARREGKTEIPGRGKFVSCGGVFSKLAVRADGVIVPCNQMSQVELGRINQDSVKNIWHNHPELKRLRERRNISLENSSFCRGCVYLNYCAGGCPALAYTTAGSDSLPSKDSCLRLYLESGGKLPDRELITV